MENQQLTVEEKMTPQTDTEQNAAPHALDFLINEKIEKLEALLGSSGKLTRKEKETIAKQATAVVEQAMENPSPLTENAALQKLEELIRMAGEMPKKETTEKKPAEKTTENNIVSSPKTEHSPDPGEKKDETKTAPASLELRVAAKKLTEDALHILADAERVPLLKSSELRKIAEANDIDMLPEDTPENIVQKLKDKRDGIAPKKPDASQNAKDKEEKEKNALEAKTIEETLKQLRKDRVGLRSDIFIEEERSKNGKQTSSEDSPSLKKMRGRLAILEQQITDAEKKEKQYRKDGSFAPQSIPAPETKIIDADKQKETEEKKTDKTPEKPPHETKKEEAKQQKENVELSEKTKKRGFFNSLFSLFERTRSPENAQENDIIVDLEEADKLNSQKTNVSEKISETRGILLTTEEKSSDIADNHLPYLDEKKPENAPEKNIPVTIKVISEKEGEIKPPAALPETSINISVSEQKEKEETIVLEPLSAEESIKKLGEPYAVKNEHSIRNIFETRFSENEYFKKLPSRAQNFMIDTITDDMRHLSKTELQEMGMTDAPNIHSGDTLLLQKIIEKKKGNIMSAFRAHGAIPSSIPSSPT